MWLYELAGYEFSPTSKLLITWGIAFALFIVYCWNPGTRKPRRNFSDNNVMNYVEVNPYDLQGDPKSIRPKVKRHKPSTHHETLIRLDKHVKHIREHQLNNVDEV